MFIQKESSHWALCTDYQCMTTKYSINYYVQKVYCISISVVFIYIRSNLYLEGLFLYALLWRDVLWYSVVCLSVCLSVCPSVGPGLVGWTVSSRILQLRTFDKQGERKMPIVFQGQWSKVKVVLLHRGKRCKQDTEWTVSSRIIQLGSMMRGFQGQRSKVKVVLSHSRKTLLAGYWMNHKLQDHTT